MFLDNFILFPETLIMFWCLVIVPFTFTVYKIYMICMQNSESLLMMQRTKENSFKDNLRNKIKKHFATSKAGLILI